MVESDFLSMGPRIPSQATEITLLKIIIANKIIIIIILIIIPNDEQKEKSDWNVSRQQIKGIVLTFDNSSKNENRSQFPVENSSRVN